MTRDPTTMPPGKTAIEALRLMQDGRYRHVPIVDQGKVVGIVSRFDFGGLELDRLDRKTGLWERIYRSTGVFPSTSARRLAGAHPMAATGLFWRGKHQR